MTRIKRHPVLSAVVGIALAVAIVVGGLGVYLAGQAGELPWQTDPTRISGGLTPFAGLLSPTPIKRKPTSTPVPVASPKSESPVASPNAERPLVSAGGGSPTAKPSTPTP